MTEKEQTPTPTETTQPLWSVADIAAYYQRSTRQARRITETEGFPPPVRGDALRWVPAQVQAWAEGPPAADGSTTSADNVLRPKGGSSGRMVRRKAA